MESTYNKLFERSLIVLTILSGILSIINPLFIPAVFILPAIIFFVRVIKDFRMKNDKQASRNLTIMIIFIIGTVLIYKLIWFLSHLKYKQLVPHLVISIEPERIINNEVDLFAVHRYIEAMNERLEFGFTKENLYTKNIEDDNKCCDNDL